MNVVIHNHLNNSKKNKTLEKNKTREKQTIRGIFLKTEKTKKQEKRKKTEKTKSFAYSVRGHLTPFSTALENIKAVEDRNQENS